MKVLSDIKANTFRKYLRKPWYAPYNGRSVCFVAGLVRRLGFGIGMDQKDHDIWKEYVKSVQRLKDKNTVTRICYEVLHSPERNILPKKTQREIVIPERVASIEVMNRGERRKFREEAVLDLHGFQLKNVGKTLETFSAKCIVCNIRNVLVITGKGGGIVRAETERWIRSSPTYVISFFPVFDSRKETGAFAVRLRRNDSA